MEDGKGDLKCSNTNERFSFHLAPPSGQKLTVHQAQLYWMSLAVTVLKWGHAINLHSCFVTQLIYCTGVMSYFSTERTLLSRSTDLGAATAPGLPQDLRLLSEVSQAHWQFVWISWALMRDGPYCCGGRTRVAPLPRANSVWIDRSEGLCMSIVWVETQKSKIL